MFNQSDFSPFLGAFEKLREATISFFMSVRPHGTTRPARNRFLCNFIFDYFSKICREISSFINNLPIIMGALYEYHYTFFDHM